MENFFATIAQVSFTVVSLFFVAITLDSESRNFWFNQKPHARYTYLNFLVMLLPGFMALGSLINIADISMVSDDVFNNYFPSWPIIGLFLFIISAWITYQTFRLRKDPNYDQIRLLEYKIGVFELSIFWTLGLLILSVFGFASAFMHDRVHLFQQELALKSLIYLLTISNVFPAMVFVRHRYEEKLKPQSLNISANLDVHNREEINIKSKGSLLGINSLTVLVVALFAFLLGLFIPKK